jgi:Uncharacterised nucleotidyltransferase
MRISRPLKQQSKTLRRDHTEADPADARPLCSQPPQWSDLIPEDDWSTYRAAIEAVRATGISFLLGGGFAMSTYIQRWRETKDIDFYVLPKDREALVRTLDAAGFTDYYDELPYDRGWIYRSKRNGVIVDIIWAMANRRASVDDLWFKRAKEACIRDELFQVLPVEELIWAKLYVLQGDRCDWPDVINLLHATTPTLDWEHLLERLGDDLPLFRSAMILFDWVSPRRAAEVPEKIRSRLELSKPVPVMPEEEKRRQALLDTRGWFAAFQQTGQPLEV